MLDIEVGTWAVVYTSTKTIFVSSAARCQYDENLNARSILWSIYSHKFMVRVSTHVRSKCISSMYFVCHDHHLIKRIIWWERTWTHPLLPTPYTLGSILLAWTHVRPEWMRATVKDSTHSLSTSDRCWARCRRSLPLRKSTHFGRANPSSTIVFVKRNLKAKYRT